MGWWRDTFRWLGREQKYDSRDLLRDLMGGRVAKSGVTVTPRTALEVTTAFACLRVKANGIAQVPLKLFQESDDERRMPAEDHPLYDVLKTKPNEWQTSFEYREMLAFHLHLTGNHYSFANRVQGAVRELIPFEPQQVSVQYTDSGAPRYFVTNRAGEQREFPRESIWHVRGPSWDSILGLETVHLMREALGLSIATQNAHSNLYRGGVQSSGAYSIEGKLDPLQYNQLREWLGKFRDGGEYAGEPLILDRAAKFLTTQMTGVDAQHVETRKLQIAEVCRGLGVLPVMVGHSDQTQAYASVEQMFLAHVVHSLAPDYQRIEQSIDANLLTPADRKAGVYAKFVEEGLLRGSLKDTKDMLLGYVNGGLMTPNEGREKLDLNPDSDPESDKLRVPANVVGITAPGGDAIPKPTAVAA